MAAPDQQRSTSESKAAILVMALVGISALLGAAMTVAAWQHNPQGEIMDGSRIDYGTLFTIFGTWFSLSMGVLGLPVILRVVFKSNKPK